MTDNTILSSIWLNANVKQIEVKAENIARKQKPGQFIILRVDNSGERVPLTIVGSDLQNGSITLIVQDVGKSTHALCSLEPGEVLHDLVGPLGNPSHIEDYGRVVIVGGGVGTAVAYPVAKALKAAGNHVTTIFGARNKDLVILENEMKAVSDECYVTTDDGSYGFHGFVTQKLQQLIDSGKSFDHAFAIGPLPMMRAVADVTRPVNIPTTVSLNSIMVDGTGMCGGCRVRVGSETKFTCVDGPEFDGHLVDFGMIINRNKAYIHEETCSLDLSIEKIKLEEKAGKVKIPRQNMPEREAKERISSFDEVNLGFTEELALKEAERCLQCRKPLCVDGCPVSEKIPQFIQLVKDRKFLEAADKIKEDNVLGRVCGRVCPQSDQCEKTCILSKKGEPVAIGALERFVTDLASTVGVRDDPPPTLKTGHKVAIIGSGPSGLTCAGDLVRSGHDVTIFEAFHDFGGVLVYGIPEFRLPKEIVREQVESLQNLGVKFIPNSVIGISYTIDELLSTEGFDAVFIGVGAGLPNFMHIPGEDLVGIYSANEFLTRVNLMKAWQFPKVDTPLINVEGKHVAVIGGGNTALDSARVALRLGAKQVDIIYRRSEAEMPGRLEEIKHAQEEGVNFTYLSAPIEFMGNKDGRLTGMQLLHMSLGAPDSSGRRRPIPITGSEHLVPVELVVIAIGNGSNPIIQKTTPDLEFNKWGNIIVDENSMETSKPGVFAGGDIVTGGATVILAMGAGRKAAAAMNEYLKTKNRE
jgi:glutamate synthase (NADPH/NADH) small chain